MNTMQSSFVMSLFVISTQETTPGGVPGSNGLFA